MTKIKTSILSKAQVNFLLECCERQFKQLPPLNITRCKFSRTLVRKQYIETHPFFENDKLLFGVFLSAKGMMLVNELTKNSLQNI